jgi:hypothetical protein
MKLMKPRIPELLLILYMLLPMKDALVALVLLSQVRAIHITRQVEKKVNLALERDGDEVWAEFISAFWFDPGNTAAYAYIGLFAPHLNLVSHPLSEIRSKIAKKQFVLSNHAVKQSILYQIQSSEIADVIYNGQLIESFSDAVGKLSYLIRGLTQTRKILHVKCSDSTQPLIKIIAVYEPDPDRWD